MQGDDDANSGKTRAIALTVLTRQGCHLCEEMTAVVRQVAAELALPVELRDVDEAPRLAELYGAEVPVLLVNGRKAFKYRLTARDLRRRLVREGGRRWPWPGWGMQAR